jgi:stage II sporulation protein R
MRKLILFVVIILFILTIVNNEKDEEIRVRIIPNSNNEYDLKIKNKVKESVVYYLYNIYEEEYENYKKNIINSIDGLEKIISKEYSNCTISFDKHTLYNKTYNGNKVKDEECLVLLIILGEGKGDNWWGSVYPKYLEVSGSDVVEYESLFITLFNKIKGDNDEN